jgi:hypothetical protein
VSRKSWPPIIERAAEIVDEYETPVTLRQLFYRLVSEGLIVNKLSDYKRLSWLTAAGRRARTFPALVDPTRSITKPIAFDSPADALDSTARIYRRDRLEGQAVRPLIVVEKATLVALISSWFGDPWGIAVAPLRGYASESYEREIVEEVDTSPGEVELLYCGDFDSSGEDIPASFARTTGLVLRRVALLWEQIETHDLPVEVGKATDSRAAAFIARHGRNVQVEVEAMPPDVLHALLRDELEAIVDTSAIEDARQREDAERQKLIDLAAGYSDG